MALRVMPFLPFWGFQMLFKEMFHLSGRRFPHDVRAVAAR